MTDSWKVSTIKAPAEATPALFQAMQAQQIAGICIKNAITEKVRQKLLANIHKVGVEYYEGDNKAGTTARKGKLGPNYFRFKDQPEEYWRRVEQYRPIFNEKIFSKYNLTSHVMEICQQGFQSETATIVKANGREFMACTIRDLTSASPHADWVKRDLPELEFTQQINGQFAWNVYLQREGKGGDTIIYKRDTKSEGSQIQDAEAAQVTPENGDLLIFRSTNVHEVTPSEAGSRITVSGFFGTQEGQVLFWI